MECEQEPDDDKETLKIEIQDDATTKVRIISTDTDDTASEVPINKLKNVNTPCSQNSERVPKKECSSAIPTVNSANSICDEKKNIKKCEDVAGGGNEGEGHPSDALHEPLTAKTPSSMTQITETRPSAR